MTSHDPVTAAGECLASALRTLYGLDGSTVDEAARAAWTPTGPGIDELTQRIGSLRQAAQAA